MPQASIQVANTLQRITSAEFMRVGREMRARSVSVPMLGFLVLESLRKYFVDPRQFGNTRRSFDCGMKPFFDYLAFHTDDRRNRIKELVSLYEQRIRTRMRRRVDGRPAADYLADIGKNIAFSECAKDLFTKGLVPPGVQIEGSPQQFLLRNIKATITKIHCADPEEVLHDEVYFFTGASLADFTGNWKKNTAASALANGIGAGDNVPLSPSGVDTLFDWELVKPSEDIALPPVTAVCSISLLEHEHGDTRRIYEAFSAAYSTAKLLAAIGAGTAGGPLGIATALVGILVSLAIALDGDDELGSVVFRFDDVLGGPPIATAASLEGIVEGSHLGNNYKYKVILNYAEQDRPGSYPGFEVTGTGNLKIRDMVGGATGLFRIASDAQLSDISWTASALSLEPPPAIGSPCICGGGSERETTVEFRQPGSYTVQASAYDQAVGTRRSGSHRVRVVYEELPASGIPSNPL